MNIYLTALIATLVILAVGFVFYGIYYTKVLGQSLVTPPLAGIVVSMAAIYLAALGFTFLYHHVLIGGLTGAAKGGTLGLLVGGLHLGLPIAADRNYLKTDNRLVAVVLANWLFAFFAAGLVIGALIP